MPDLTDLITRVENAPPEMEWPLLEEGFLVIFPEIKTGFAGPIFEWESLCQNFRDKLDAGAGLCAAMMFVPDGAGLHLDRYWIASNEAILACRAIEARHRAALKGQS